MARGDFLAHHIPTQLVLSDRLRSGTWPAWNPLIFGGQPFAADPATAACYPPVAAAALLVSPDHPYRHAWVLAWLVVGHLALAGWGMALLLRRWDCGWPGAVFGGVAWSLSHALVARAGQFPVLAGWSWLPLVLLGLEWAVFERQHRWRWVAGITIGLSWLAGYPQVALLTLLAAVILFIGQIAAGPAAHRPRALNRWAACWVIATGIAAVQILPAAEFARLANRSVPGGLAYASHYSAPPGLILRELCVPRDDAGAAAAYTGLVTLLVCLFGFSSIGTKLKWPLLAVGAVGCLIAAGGYSAFLGPLWYWWSPVTLRAPARAMGLASFALAALGGLSLEALTRGRIIPPARRAALRWTGFLWVAVALAASIRLGLWATRGGLGADVRPEAADSFAVLVVISGATLAVLAMTGRRAGWLLTALLVVDLLHSGDVRMRPTRPPAYPGLPEQLPRPGRMDWKSGLAGREAREGGNYLLANIAPAYFRMASPSGYNPLHLRRYGQLIQGVALPTAAEGAWIGEWLDMRNIPAGLGKLLGSPDGVRDRVFLARALERAGDPNDALRRIHAPGFDWRVAIAAPGDAGDLEPGTFAGGTVTVMTVAPERFEVEIASRGRNLLVFVDNDYPGWRATLNGRPVPIIRVDHTFKSVPLGAGAHRVVFEFRSRWGIAGLLISLMTLLAAGFVIRRTRR